MNQLVPIVVTTAITLGLVYGFELKKKNSIDENYAAFKENVKYCEPIKMIESESGVLYEEYVCVDSIKIWDAR